MVKYFKGVVTICIESYVDEVQHGDMNRFNELEEKFKPMILTWLKKIHQLNTNETEDYLSVAKIILLECAKKFDKTKNVPFASYYKISLYHWYGNQMRKKKVECISLENFYNVTGIEDDYCDDNDIKEKVQLLALSMGSLNTQEQDILNKLLEGQSPIEIAHSLNLSKKTVLNRKYIIIKKLRAVIENYLNEKNQRTKEEGRK